ncbi:MAG: hypothetical protein ACRENS_03610 [Candidatus Eiseniibacteriota bacterium]
MFEDSSATPIRIYVVWLHVTHSDRQMPNSLVLAEMPDPRARQYWDPYRLLSKVMVHDFPPESSRAMADTSGGPVPLYWDFVGLWRPGAIWTEQLPLPDFNGRPILDHVADFRRRVGELARLTPARRAP